jgi:hypothetical protein
MSISRTIAIPSFVAAMLVFMSQPLFADTVYLWGQVGGFPICASLEQNEAQLSGWYFYHSQARQIRLQGQVDPKGTLYMEEMSGDRKTGLFEGKVKDGRWTGTWRKTDSAAPLPFHLEENCGQLGNITRDYQCTATERVTQYHYTYQRSLTLAISNGVVKKFEATQKVHGDDQDEQMCTIDLNDLTQIASDAGLLLQFEDDDSETDAGTCSVRILGDKDLLWIRFGDTSVPGNDCRSAGSTMFCSPRAFWNDIILDRRTGKCRALQ